MISLFNNFSKPFFPVFSPGTLISLSNALFSRSVTLVSETYPTICDDEPSSEYFLAKATTGFTPCISYKKRLSLENSDQDKLSETITVSQGLRFFSLFIKLLLFLALKSIIFDNLKNNSSILGTSSGIICN